MVTRYRGLNVVVVTGVSFSVGFYEERSHSLKNVWLVIIEEATCVRITCSLTFTLELWSQQSPMMCS